MSWARFGWDDAYMYPAIDHGYYCQSCHLMPTAYVPEREVSRGLVMPGGDVHQSFSTRDPDAFLDHVAAHRAVGDFLNDDVEDGVREWAAENPR